MRAVSLTMGLPHFLLHWSLRRKQARTEEFWSCSNIHRSFEGFQAIDLSFCLAVAPRLSNRILHGVDVSLRRASKTLHRVQAGKLGIFQPDAELADGLALEHAPEPHGESTHCGEFWPILFHRVDFCSLISGQQSTRLDAERRGHNRRDRTSSRGIDKLRIRDGQCGLYRLAFRIAPFRQ